MTRVPCPHSAWKYSRIQGMPLALWIWQQSMRHSWEKRREQKWERITASSRLGKVMWFTHRPDEQEHPPARPPADLPPWTLPIVYISHRKVIVFVSPHIREPHLILTFMSHPIFEAHTFLHLEGCIKPPARRRTIYPALFSRLYWISVFSPPLQGS